MIFDNGKVTFLVERWKVNHSGRLLIDIINECTALIEVVVSRFDSIYREELIQECKLLLIEKLDNFDSDRGRLHAWLTSVFTNHCINYVTAASRMLNLDDMEIEEGCDESETFNYDISKIIARNRQRFPNVPSTMIDDITHYVCLSAMYSVYGKSRGAIRHITNTYKLSRSDATVLYHSTLLYMRQLHMEECDITKVVNPDTMTMLYDLKQVLGDDLYAQVAVLFSGIYVKFI